MVLLFSKNVYTASLSSYYTFYLIDTSACRCRRRRSSVRLPGALVAGTLSAGRVGGPVGRMPVIWFSILGVLPFTLVLPYASCADGGPTW